MGQNGVSNQLLGRVAPYLQKNIIHLKMIQIDAVGGEIWRIGSEK